MTSLSTGCLAQLVEHRPYKARVVGSIPTAPTIYIAGVVVQLVRIPACHAGGRGFESRPLRQFSKNLNINLKKIKARIIKCSY
ncbi:MAG: hypothetical protein QG624_989 [Pseudomonadota bacterium]|jgi:hypothetical protein|nr:hypothetical protein [Pseudomonadota bacterium]